MVDFKLLRQQQENAKIIQKLDNLGVPEQGTLSWYRLTKFAKQYGGWEFNEEAPDWNFNEGESATIPTWIKRKEGTTELADVSELPPIKEIVLSEDQEKAWQKLVTWVANTDPYFVLKGFAGTGKSFLMKKLQELDKTLYYTAPTNKATKVLSRFVETEAKTTFSQLGLRMSADDDKLVMEYGARDVYMPKNSILVVDEASMIGRELYNFIDETRKRTGCKILYVGDPAQLPPVGEKRTPAWNCTAKKENIAVLRKVMRYDNQLLKLATRIRTQMKQKDYDTYPIEDDNADGSGVFVLQSKKQLLKRLAAFKKPEDFLSRKIIAWRNKTVNSYNNIIRENFGFTDPYNVGDIILLAEPIEKNDVIIAHVDDEFQIKSIDIGDVKTSCRNLINCYVMKIENEDGCYSVNVPVESEDLDDLLTTKANIAKKATGLDRRDAWRDFWETKKLFAAMRYGYSITAHRSQGSSYTEVYIDQHDILANRNEREAFKCLYVSCTRPTTNLFTF